jgi:hypothetical protein
MQPMSVIRAATASVVGAFRRWWTNHFSGFDRREKWGYGVWFFFAGLVLVPEFWAAFWSDSAPFPTISGTTGALEYDHPVLALVVAGVIVLCAYSAFRYPPVRTGVLAPKGKATGGWLGEDTLLPYRTPAGGRFTRSTTPVHEIRAWLYFVCAFVVITGVTTWAAISSDGVDEFRVGRTLYGLTVLFWIVIPSLLAWPKRFAADVPFPTLFSTVRSLERRLRVVALVAAAGLVILLIHLVLYPWPSTIPDISRLHADYKCRPIPPAKPLTAKELADCQKRDEAENGPAPDAP